MSIKSKNLGFRGWFYFRQGWSNYLTFILGAVNTLTITYFLAIEKYPPLEVIFPNFIQYVLIVSTIGIPLLVIIGYSHWKKTAARKAEVDIFYETNPYIIRILVNTEIMIKLNLKLTDKLISVAKDGKISDEELNDLKELQNELLEFTKKRKFRNKNKGEYGEGDWKFFSNEVVG